MKNVINCGLHYETGLLVSCAAATAMAGDARSGSMLPAARVPAAASAGDDEAMGHTQAKAALAAACFMAIERMHACAPGRGNAPDGGARCLCGGLLWKVADTNH